MPQPPRPFALLAELTYRCPLKCPYCSNPLVPFERFAKPMTRLNPVFEIDGQRLVMATTDLAGVDSRALGELVGTLKDRHYEIVGAVDFLLSGF